MNQAEVSRKTNDQFDGAGLILKQNHDFTQEEAKERAAFLRGNDSTRRLLLLALPIGLPTLERILNFFDTLQLEEQQEGLLQYVMGIYTVLPNGYSSADEVLTDVIEKLEKSYKQNDPRFTEKLMAQSDFWAIRNDHHTLESVPKRHCEILTRPAPTRVVTTIKIPVTDQAGVEHTVSIDIKQHDTATAKPNAFKMSSEEIQTLVQLLTERGFSSLTIQNFFNRFDKDSTEYLIEALTTLPATEIEQLDNLSILLLLLRTQYEPLFKEKFKADQDTESVPDARSFAQFFLNSLKSRTAPRWNTILKNVAHLDVNKGQNHLEAIASVQAALQRLEVPQIIQQEVCRISGYASSTYEKSFWQNDIFKIKKSELVGFLNLIIGLEISTREQALLVLKTLKLKKEYPSEGCWSEYLNNPIETYNKNLKTLLSKAKPIDRDLFSESLIRVFFKTLLTLPNEKFQQIIDLSPECYERIIIQFLICLENEGSQDKAFREILDPILSRCNPRFITQDFIKAKSEESLKKSSHSNQILDPKHQREKLLLQLLDKSKDPLPQLYLPNCSLFTRADPCLSFLFEVQQLVISHDLEKLEVTLPKMTKTLEILKAFLKLENVEIQKEDAQSLLGFFKTLDQNNLFYFLTLTSPDSIFSFFGPPQETENATASQQRWKSFIAFAKTIAIYSPFLPELNFEILHELMKFFSMEQLTLYGDDTTIETAKKTILTALKKRTSGQEFQWHREMLKNFEQSSSVKLNPAAIWLFWQYEEKKDINSCEHLNVLRALVGTAMSVYDLPPGEKEMHGRPALNRLYRQSYQRREHHPKPNKSTDFSFLEAFFLLSPSLLKPLLEAKNFHTKQLLRIAHLFINSLSTTKKEDTIKEIVPAVVQNPESRSPLELTLCRPRLWPEAPVANSSGAQASAFEAKILVSVSAVESLLGATEHEILLGIKTDLQRHKGKGAISLSKLLETIANTTYASEDVEALQKEKGTTRYNVSVLGIVLLAFGIEKSQEKLQSMRKDTVSVAKLSFLMLRALHYNGLLNLTGGDFSKLFQRNEGPESLENLEAFALIICTLADTGAISEEIIRNIGKNFSAFSSLEKAHKFCEVLKELCADPTAERPALPATIFEKLQKNPEAFSNLSPIELKLIHQFFSLPESQLGGEERKAEKQKDYERFLKNILELTATPKTPETILQKISEHLLELRGFGLSHLIHAIKEKAYALTLLKLWEDELTSKDSLLAWGFLLNKECAYLTPLFLAEKGEAPPTPQSHAIAHPFLSTFKRALKGQQPKAALENPTEEIKHGRPALNQAYKMTSGVRRPAPLSRTLEEISKTDNAGLQQKFLTHLTAVVNPGFVLAEVLPPLGDLCNLILELAEQKCPLDAGLIEALFKNHPISKEIMYELRFFLNRNATAIPRLIHENLQKTFLEKLSSSQANAAISTQEIAQERSAERFAEKTTEKFASQTAAPFAFTAFDQAAADEDEQDGWVTTLGNDEIKHLSLQEITSYIGELLKEAESENSTALLSHLQNAYAEANPSPSEEASDKMLVPVGVSGEKAKVDILLTLLRAIASHNCDRLEVSEIQKGTLTHGVLMRGIIECAFSANPESLDSLKKNKRSRNEAEITKNLFFMIKALDFNRLLNETTVQWSLNGTERDLNQLAPRIMTLADRGALTDENLNRALQESAKRERPPRNAQPKPKTPSKSPQRKKPDDLLDQSFHSAEL